MAAKRRARRARSEAEGFNKLGRNGGGNEGFNDSDDEESGESGEDAIPSPLKRDEQRSPPSPEDAGSQGSGEASPARGGVAKTPTSKRAKKSPPASQEEDEAGDSGDATPARGGPLPGDGADAGRGNKRAATPKRGEKRSPPPLLLQEDERAGKRAAGADADAETGAAKSPKRKKKKSKRATEKDRRKKKKKKQLRKALVKPTSPPSQLLELELNDNSGDGDGDEDTPSIPEIEHPAREQPEEITEQHAGDTSPPHGTDMHIAHAEEQPEEEEEAADNTSSSPPKENAPPNKLRRLETKKKPVAERQWSYDDELKILGALVEYTESHDGALPDSSHLLAVLTFDKIDANVEKLTDKIRKLKRKYQKMISQGCPSDPLARRLFKLSEKLWGVADEDVQVEPTSGDFSARSKLYPHLAKEVKAYAEAHNSRDLIMEVFMAIDDEKARDLDAKCKKLQVEAFKLELGQASLITELLSASSSLARVRF